MRLFTALDLPDDLQRGVATLQSPGTLPAQWSSPDQYHITIRFLGDVNSDRAHRYATALEKLEAPPVRCSLYGLDVLPSRRRPLVLIVGLERTPSLVNLYRTVSAALEREGLEPEDRTYRPHVTLARLDDEHDPASIHSFLDQHDPGPLPSFQATEFSLYESTLTQEGALHKRRASFQLEN